MDPNFRLTYSGEQGAINDQYCWESDKEESGVGCHTTTELKQNEFVKTRMDFKKPFENTSYSSIKLSQDSQGTKVIWDMDAELPNPLNLKKLMMDKNMDISYGKGLENLKTLCEK